METKRLDILKAKPKDYKRIYELTMSDYVREHNMIQEATYEEFEADLIDKQIYEWYLYLKDSGQVIGSICCYPNHIRHGVSSKIISYWLDEAYSGQGYMKEALEAFIEYLWESGVEVINARVFAENTASHNLIKGLGFKQEGYLEYAVRDLNDVVRDDVIYVMINKK